MSTPPPSAPRPTLRLVGAALLVVAIGAGSAALFLPGMRTTMAEAQQAKATPAKIDGDRAYGYLKDICKFGPHPAGSAANAKVRAMVAEHFRKLGGKVREQAFAATDPISNAPVAMVNLIASWFPERNERVVLAAHYDSRPFPDEDPDPAKRKQPFLGANDPGSGIALLMEIAHHLEDSETPWGVDLVLFDGEELVYGGGQDQQGEYFFGSKAFAKEYSERKKGGPKYAAGILFDLVGGKDLVIEKEQYSLEFAPKLVGDVWAVAKSLKVAEFRDRTGPAVYDDHLALNNGGIPTIDLIQFPYKYWHTADDLPENCSGESLAQVGKVVTAWLNKPKPKAR